MFGRDILVGITRCVFWLRKIGKGKGKCIKRQKAFLAHFFMKINEIRRKGM